ncbi:hypothetical protein [Comamonas sp. GB3 AK4-5]|uniref:hypothetical protein n=1 Tax=Comamonas sp. GB3 AK4-5 TaxID=3231487 RepID=UPI00351F19E2
MFEHPLSQWHNFLDSVTDFFSSGDKNASSAEKEKQKESDASQGKDHKKSNTNSKMAAHE